MIISCHYCEFPYRRLLQIKNCRNRKFLLGWKYKWFLGKGSICHFNKSASIEKDLLGLKRCLVPLDKFMDFPLLNTSKSSYQCPRDGVINLDSKIGYSENRSMPSVTKVLNATMNISSRIALSKWRANMISELGEVGFQEFYKGQLENGSDFHDKIQKHFKGDTQDLMNSPNLAVRSVSNISDLISDVSVIESHVVHEKLAYRGIIDCVAKFKNKPYLIEWKRSSKKKVILENTYDAPLQLCAYLGAMNYDSNYNLQVDGALVVVAYTDGTPADVFTISIEECQRYWKQWLTRLKEYNTVEGGEKLPQK